MLEPGCTVVYIPILQTIQEMFKHTDILDRIKETKIHKLCSVCWMIANLPGKYCSALHVIHYVRYLIFRGAATEGHLVLCYKTFAHLSKMVYSLSALVTHFGAQLYVLCLIIWSELDVWRCLSMQAEGAERATPFQY